MFVADATHASDILHELILRWYIGTRWRRRQQGPGAKSGCTLREEMARARLVVLQDLGRPSEVEALRDRQSDRVVVCCRRTGRNRVHSGDDMEQYQK